MLARHLLLPTVVGSLAAAASSQVLGQLVVEGDTPWGIPSGELVVSVGQLTRNDDGYGVAFRTSGTSGLRNWLWGSCCNDVVPVGFRETKSLAGFDQLLFEGPWSYWGVDHASYSALGMLGSQGPLDSVWLDDTPLAIEGQAIPSLPGKRWGAQLEVVGQATPAQTWWLAEVVDIQSGASEGLGLFQGVAATVVFRSGDVLPGTGAAIDLDGIRDVHLSGDGNHFVALIETVEPPAGNGYLIVDGAVAQLAGTPVREGAVLPAAIGGLPGEHWVSLDSAAIGQTDNWVLSAHTDAGAALDQVFVRGGAVALREGDTIPGGKLTGDIGAIYVSVVGDITGALWAVESTQGPVEAAIVADRVISRVGDAVDLDGNGTPEPGHVISELEQLALSWYGRTMVVARIDTQGTPSLSDDVRSALWLLTGVHPYGVGKLNSLGKQSKLSYSGFPSISFGNFRLEVSDLVPGSFGLAIYSDSSAQVPFANHFFYLGSPITRILPPKISSAQGTVSVPIPITQSMLFLPRYFQYWSRDAQHPDGTGVELSNALQVTPGF
jgi:hypothetical protein